MSNKKKKKTPKRRGHYCWSCGRSRPNEEFSGKGHRRHLCRDCARLGSEELAYRQAVSDIGRCLCDDGRIRRKQRKTFEQFLHHENPRIRALAVEVQEEDRLARASWEEIERLEEEWAAALIAEEDGWPEGDEPIDIDSARHGAASHGHHRDDEIPF